MRYDDFRRSDDIEDRRDDSGGGMGGGGGGFGLPMGGGGLGIGTVIVLGLISYAFGIDPRILIGGAEILSGGGQAPSYQTDRRSGPGQDRRADRRDGQHDLRHSRRDRRSLERDLPGRGAILQRVRRSCCSATPPTADAAAWRSRRWGRSTARRTRRSFSTPDSSARSRRAFAAARAMPASSPRPTSSPMKPGITSRTCSASCRA